MTSPQASLCCPFARPNTFKPRFMHAIVVFCY